MLEGTSIEDQVRSIVRMGTSMETGSEKEKDEGLHSLDEQLKGFAIALAVLP